MNLIKSVISLITFLMMIGVGVEGIEAIHDMAKGKAIKAHKRGMVSLQKWNSQLQVKSKN